MHTQTPIAQFANGERISSGSAATDVPPITHFSTMKIAICTTLLLALSFTWRESNAESPFDAVHEEADRLVKKSFSDGKLVLDTSLSRNGYSFSTKMREFMVYTPDKIGNWQGPFKTSAPDRGGFSVTYYIEEGPWRGALAVPNVGTEDRYLFRHSYVVKESEDKKYHIWAAIVTPRYGSDDKLRDALMKLFSDFDVHRQMDKKKVGP